MFNSLILGFFDGVHKAHKAVINTAVDYASKHDAKPILITFKESPAVYFGHSAEYILPREESVNKIKKCGVDEVIQLDFPRIACMKPEEYLEYLVKTYSPVSISTGFNHTFGYKKAGDYEFLKKYSSEYGYEYLCVPPMYMNDEIVSSTTIKKCLREGNIQKANSFLDDRFSLQGLVIHGAHLGTQIGFPTANIDYPSNIVKIPFGVYKVYAVVDNVYKPAIMNWGMKPTVNNTLKTVVEVHILNYCGNLYGTNLRIEIEQMIRQERKFGSLDELKEQIKKDVQTCIEL